MSSLLEIQRVIYRSLVARENTSAIEHIALDGLAPEARLNIYRSTFIGSLTTALRLSYPAVHRLVGAKFFESAARIFIEEGPPQSAHLDQYGAEFSAFLERFPPAASLVYVPEVARLEWAVACALHAPDMNPLEVAQLATLPPSGHDRVCFAPHPSISLVQARHPVDTIWRAVLAEDDSALAQIDWKAGAIWLLVERLGSGIEVTRIDEPEWRFLSALCASRPLGDAIKAAGQIDASAVLAEHLTVGRFVSFTLTDRARAAHPLEVTS